MNTLTSDKILNAAILLFSQKGYNSVTTKEIAKKAGVSEMTVFRHFASKRNLFEKAIEKLMFSPKFKSLFENNLEWELEKDLLKISHYYQDTLLKNQEIILMHFKNDELTSEVDSPIFKFPNELRKLLVGYLAEMRNRGVFKDDPEVLAISYLAANFGFFMTNLVNKKFSPEKDLKTCIPSFIRIIVKGVTA